MINMVYFDLDISKVGVIVEQLLDELKIIISGWLSEIQK